MTHRLCFAAALFLSFLVPTPPSRAGLVAYVEKADDSFAWKLKEKKATDAGVVYDLGLTSQSWQGIKWEHQLQVYQPKEVKPTATMVLWNTGGGSRPEIQLIALEISKKIKAPIAFLYHVPNQPIFNKREDALIAETFVRYLDSKGKDETWPLLFPMVKSVVRAMDALQAFAKEEWKFEVKNFVVTGASKRGWTSWLTAATGDRRVKAIAPLVIDTLNMKAQMEKQLRDFGKYSEMIKDYTEAKLVPFPDTAEAKKLWQMVDPWFYREKLTMPKLIVNGCNDPYWTTDALNLYWDDLPGEKYILYVPNAGHNLQQKDKLNPLDAYMYALSGLAAFCRHQIIDNPMPQLNWKHSDAKDKFHLFVESNEAPKGARLWTARSNTRDFREAVWESMPMNELPTSGGKQPAFNAFVDPPKSGCVAFFAELEFEVDGIRHSLCTQMRVVGTPAER